MPRLADLGIWVVANMGPLSRGLQGATAQIHRFSTAVRGVFNRLDTSLQSTSEIITKHASQFGLWAAAGLIGLARLTRGSLELEKQLTELSTFLRDDFAGSLGTVQEQLDLYRKAARRISLQTGQAMTDLIEGVSRLVQRGYQGADAIARLEASAKFATVAFSTTNEATTAMVKIMDAFGYSTERSEEFFSKLFRAIDIAEAPAQEFMNNFVGVATAAAQVGVSFEEALALFSQLTFKEKSTAEAATDVRRAFETLIKITKQGETQAKELGWAFDSSAIATRGLVNFIKLLGEASDKARGRLLDTRKGLKAFNVAVKDTAELQRFLKTILGTTADYFEEKYNRTVESAVLRIERLKRMFEALRDTAVEALLPGVNMLTQALTALLKVAIAIPAALRGAALGLVGFLALGAGIAALTGYFSTLLVNIRLVFQAFTHGPTVARLSLQLSDAIGRMLQRIMMVGSSLIAAMPFLSRFQDSLHTLAITPQLVSRAMTRFSHLSQRHAIILARAAARVRLGLLSVAEAADMLAARGIARDLAEAEQMIRTLRMGAISIPRPTAVSRAVTTSWEALRNSIVRVSLAIQAFLLMPVGVFFNRLTSLIGNLARLLSTGLAAGLYRSIRLFSVFTRAIIGSTTALANLPLAILTLIAGTEGIWKFIKSVLYIIPLMWEFSKAMTRGMILAVRWFASQIAGFGRKVIEEISPAIQPIIKINNIIHDYIIATLDWLIRLLKNAREGWRLLWREQVAPPVGREGLGVDVEQFQHIMQQLFAAGRVSPAEIMEALEQASKDAASGLYEVTIAGQKYWMTLKSLEKAKKTYQRIVEESAKQESEAARKVLDDLEERYGKEEKRRKSKRQQIEELLKTELEAIEKARYDDEHAAEARLRAWKRYYASLKDLEIDYQKFRAKILGDQVEQRRIQFQEEVRDILQRTTNIGEIQRLIFHARRRMEEDIAKIRLDSDKKALDIEIETLDLMIREIEASKQRYDLNTLAALRRMKAEREAAREALDMTNKDAKRVILKEKLLEIDEDLKKSRESLHQILEETLNAEQKELANIRREWQKRIDQVWEYADADLTTAERQRIIAELEKRRDEEIAAARKKHMQSHIQHLEKLLELEVIRIKMSGTADALERERLRRLELAHLKARDAALETGRLEEDQATFRKEAIGIEEDIAKRRLRNAEKDFRAAKRTADTDRQLQQAREQYIARIRFALQELIAHLRELGVPDSVIQSLDTYLEAIRLLQEEIAKLEPEYESIWDAIKGGFGKAVEESKDFLTRIEEAVTDAVSNIRTTLSDVLFDWITGELNSLSGAFKNFLRGILRALADFAAQEIVKWFIDLIFGKVEKKPGGEGEAAGKERVGGLLEKWGIEEALGKIGDKIEGKFGSIFEKIKGKASDIFSDIGGLLQKLFGKIGSTLGNIFGGGSSILPFPTSGGGGIFDKIFGFMKNLWPFQAGGIAMKPIAAAIAEKGPEAVIPLDRLSEVLPGRPIQFNVYALDAISFHEYLRRNSGALSAVIQEEILSNRQLRKIITRTG
jgi:TP901 family phage tail tape measure protein